MKYRSIPFWPMTSPTIFSPSVPRSSPSLSLSPASLTIFRHSEYVRMG